MIGNFPKLKPMGERSVLIQFEPEINPVLLEKILFYKDVLYGSMVKEEVEVINTYNSLLVTYTYSIEDIYGEILRIEKLLEKSQIDKSNDSRLYHIPVCYEPEFGLDLELISTHKQISISQIIQLHTAPVYIVYFIGFLPGFLYLGGMDEKLKISRKNQPRLEVEKGAVGIGENQTGIYPKKSPGGWQIIGNSPVSFFNKNEDPPCEISAGDRVKFYAVSKDEYDTISEEVARGVFRLKSETYAG